MVTGRWSLARCTSLGTKLVIKISVRITETILDPVVLHGPSQRRCCVLQVVRGVCSSEGLFYVQEYWSASLCGCRSLSISLMSRQQGLSKAPVPSEMLHSYWTCLFSCLPHPTPPPQSNPNVGRVPAVLLLFHIVSERSF